MINLLKSHTTKVGREGEGREGGGFGELGLEGGLKTAALIQGKDSQLLAERVKRKKTKRTRTDRKIHRSAETYPWEH